MSHKFSDPALNPQFRRHWGGASTSIKFLPELSSGDLDRLAVKHGDAILRRLPSALLADLSAGERRDLARAFGRPWVRRLLRGRAYERWRHAGG